MAKTIRQSFQEFASNLEITDRQTTLVAERRGNVVAALGKKLTLYPSSPSKLIGAYDRNTLIRPLSEGDVDVMVVLNYGAHEAWYTSDGTIKCLDRFREILDEAYPYTSKRRDRNCITMGFSEFRFDVVPAFYNNDDYYLIPDSIRRAWLPTNPFKFADRITEVNKHTNSTFVPLIKMVKAWNRENKYLLRSFQIECMMYSHFRLSTSELDYPYSLQQFFNSLSGYLSGATKDPVMGDRVDLYLDNGATPPDRQIAIDKAKHAAAKSKEAYDDQTRYASAIQIAIGEWKSLMGQFFPAYG
jgi:hypothetical protein